MDLTYVEDFCESDSEFDDEISEPNPKRMKQTPRIWHKIREFEFKGTKDEGASEKKEDQKKDAKNPKVTKDDDEAKNEENKDGAKEGENKDKDGKDKDNSKEKKKPPKKSSKVSSKKPASKKGNLEKPLLGQLSELNPSSIISELNNTPVDKLKHIEPLLENLTENLQGTNLGNYFKSLTSVVEMRDLKSVIKFFPNLVSTTFNYLAQLGSYLAVAFGRFGRTVVDLFDVLFNGAKSLLALLSPVAGLIPGGKAVLNVANSGVSTLHSATVDPADDAADALKTTGKSLLKRLRNAQISLPV